MYTTTVPAQAVASLLAGPARRPPDGVIPNFENPDNNHAVCITLLAVAYFIMLGAIVMRLFTDWVLSKIFVWETILIILAFGVATAHGIVCIVATGAGVGVHMWDQTLATFIRGSALINIIAILYGPVVALIKVAILFQFLRIFSPTRQVNPWMFYACWTWIVVTTLFYLLDTVLIIVQCLPRERIWNPLISGHCITSGIDLFIAASLFNVISDTLILVLPLPVIIRLHMNPRKKVLVVCLFLTGIFACVASIMRLYYSYLIILNPDPTWNYDAMGVCCWYEMSMGTLVFCLPVAPKFCRFAQDKLYSSLMSRQKSVTASDSEAGKGRAVWENRGIEDNRRAKAGDSLGISSIRQYLGPRSIVAMRHHRDDTHHLASDTDGKNSLAERSDSNSDIPLESVLPR